MEFARALAAVRDMIPEGRALPDEVWSRRHRGITWLLVVQSLALFVFALIRGSDPIHAVQEMSIVAAAAALASWKARGRLFRSGVAVLGLVTSSALLVHFSGGTVEAHFHFFAMVAVITLYQDWWPFLLALGFVLVHHGVVGVLDPGSVYNHPAAIAHPWRWAMIHAVFVLFAATANVVAWRLNEASREHAEGAEAQRENMLGLLTATLESTADGILVVDASGKITSYNKQFVQMWGLPDDIMASGDDQAAISFVLDQLTDPAGFLAKVRELYSQPDAESYDQLVFKDGRMLERYSKPQKVGDVSVGRVWSFRDVTQRSRLDQMKNDFLSAVSHELRTPLTAVLGYAVTLERMYAGLSADELEDVVHRLVGSARKLDRLLVDTIDLDRLSRGIIEPHRSMTDIGSVTRNIIEENEVLLMRSIEVRAEAIANVDRAKVERIIENLLMNAARHTPVGTEIVVRAFRESGGVVIAVDDRGTGVPEAKKKTIFEPFDQGEVMRHSPGVGIGLALVARFAQLHDGRAWVEDRPGGGSTFFVYLNDDASSRNRSARAS